MWYFQGCSRETRGISMGRGFRPWNFQGAIPEKKMSNGGWGG